MARIIKKKKKRNIIISAKKLVDCVCECACECCDCTGTNSSKDGITGSTYEARKE